MICTMFGVMAAGCAAPEPEEETATESTAADEAGEAKFEGSASDYKVALLIPGSLGDKSFFDASYEAVGLLEQEYGMEVDYVECGTDASKYYPAYVDLCQGGYDLILTVSSNGDDALTQIAEEYPDQKFINLDGEMDEIPSNVYIIAPKNNEMSYLAGAVGALRTQSSYVGSFTDTAKGKENGLLLYNSGISVVFTAAGQSGIGVIDAAVQTGKYVIGVDSDQAEALKESQPEMANVVITSAIKKIPQNALHIVQKAMDGEVNYGKKEYYGLQEEAVGIADNEFYEKLMSQDNRKLIEELKGKVMNGEVELTETMGLTTEELVEIRDQVRP